MGRKKENETMILFIVAGNRWRAINLRKRASDKLTNNLFKISFSIQLESPAKILKTLKIIYYNYTIKTLNIPLENTNFVFNMNRFSITLFTNFNCILLINANFQF